MSDAFGSYLTQNPDAQDAWAYLEAILKDYGLGELMDFAKENIISGRSDAEIVQRLRETEPYKKRFAVIEQRKEQKLPAMSEAEVIAYEKQATQVLRSKGYPSGFWDQPDDFVKLMRNDISIAELDRRADQGYADAISAAPEVRDELERLYGVDTSMLAAFFLDPDRTESIIMKNFGAAQRAAQAQRTGYGTLNRVEAERLMDTGITDDQAAQGFNQLATNKELFGSLPGENAGAIDRETQFGAVFDQNAGAQQTIEKRARQRVATFSGGGGFAGSNGKTGVGSAQ